ncbi:NADPH-dependent F420 reductase [Rhodococcus sp. T2V]|uniref:NADPH-dependent F420 reductase n=1 Tax=Rhodococcus sp. T2V TaxID=3034164 RepID=UPI0023E27C52|nr:NADPH-dependent F420 reductase [Rhodococcus sp. T2V]MDF3305882.1 NADPH-dependent F420 reductase [Rhodococcus sp. T2V]
MTSNKIAVVGGTGPQGKGLAYRFAAAGRHVVIGSRSIERAEEAAAEVRRRAGDGARVSAADNASAAADCPIVLLAVPYQGHRELVSELAPVFAGKLLVSCVNPLGFDKAGAYGLDVEEGSAAEQLRDLVPDATVVAAFHHLSAVTLWEHEGLVQEDVLVCGDDRTAKDEVARLAVAITGRPGIDGGVLRVARQLEPLTAVLINVNKRYKTHSGLAVNGVVHDPRAA